MIALLKKTGLLWTMLLAIACGDTAGNPIIGLDGGGGATDAAALADVGGGSDAASGLDGTMAPDAVALEDSGQFPDAAAPSDAGAADTGEVDAGAGDAGAGDAGSAEDAGTPLRLPRLVVSSAQGISIWDRAHQLSADRAADVMLSVGGPAGGVGPLAVGSDRIFAAVNGASGGVVVLEQASTLGGAAAPLMTMAGLQVSKLSVVQDRLYAMSTVAACAGPSCIGLRVFDGAGGLGAGATWRTNLFHMWGQLPSFAVLGPTARVYAGQISGAGLLVYGATSTRTGDQPASFALDPGAYWALGVEGDQLYAGGDAEVGHSGVSIWTGALSASGATAPAVTLRSGFPPGQIFIADLAVRDDVLAVPLRDRNSVLIYEHASQIRADRAPDAVLTNPALSAPTRVLFGAAGRLYVLDDDGVLIFQPGLVGWAFVAEIKTGLTAPRDLALVE